MPTPPDTRTEPPLVGGEREQLAAFLDFHRETLVWKCAGLSDAQLRDRPLPSSALSLLGLVRHLTDVERGWFRRGIAQHDAPPLYYSDADPDGDFAVDGADVEAAWSAWRSESAASREVLAGVGSLDDTYTRPGDPREEFSVRWTLVHMIEEYARHNGHADLLRERLDGATGE